MAKKIKKKFSLLFLQNHQFIFILNANVHAILFRQQIHSCLFQIYFSNKSKFYLGKCLCLFTKNRKEKCWKASLNVNSSDTSCHFQVSDLQSKLTEKITKRPFVQLPSLLLAECPDELSVTSDRKVNEWNVFFCFNWIAWILLLSNEKKCFFKKVFCVNGGGFHESWSLLNWAA